MTRDVDFEIGAEISPLKKSLREAADSVKQFAREGELGVSGMLGPLEALRTKFLAVGSVLAGGQTLKAGIDAVKAQATEVQQLANAMGITVSEATVLQTALGNVFLDQESYVTTIRAVSRALMNNGEAFDALGIKTRDARGHLLPMQEIIANTVLRLNDFKAGADRNVMAMQLLGRGYEDVLKASKLTGKAMEEARDEVVQYHKDLDPEMVKAYKIALENFGDGAEGVTLAIGRGAMPVLTELAEWLSQAGPAATEVTVIAMDTLSGAFTSVKNVAVGVWEIISNTVRQAADGIGNALGVQIPSFGEIVINSFRVVQVAVLGLGLTFETVFEGVRAVLVITNASLQNFAAVAKAAMTLDFDGVKSSWNAGGRAVELAVEQSASRIRAMQTSYGIKIDAALTGPVGGAAPTSGNKKPGGGTGGAVDIPSGSKAGKKAKADADPSYMQYYDAALSERKRLASEENALREYTKAEELAYWQSLLDAAQLHGKDRVAIEKKVSDLTVQVRREEAKEKLALDAEVSRNRDAMAMGRVDAAQAAAQAALDMEQITKVQMAALEIDFENQRWAIQKAGQAERIALAEADPNASPAELARVKNQMLEIEQRHQIAVSTLTGKFRTEQMAETLQVWGNLGDRMSGLWDKGIQAMMNGTLRWRNAFRAIGTELVGWFANNVVGAMLKDWIAGEMKKLAMKLRFLGQEKGAQIIASGEIVGAKGAEATAVAGANAVEAGTGAAASVAPIPFIGPVLALAAMASVFAAVMAMGSRKSAAKGYDIPRGVNPLVQTHEEEMILPSKYANVIRDLAESKQDRAEPVGGNVSFTVHAVDSASVSKLFRDNGHILARELRRQARNFAPSKP